MKNITHINPEMLVWAREKASLTVEDAVRVLDLRDSRRILARQRLINIEAGLELPTRSLLDKMTKHYGRPLLTFYLSSPPKIVERGADFRALSHEPEPEDKNRLDMLLRDIRVRQSMVRSILEDEKEDESKPYIGAGQVSDGMERILIRLKEVLGLDHTQYRNEKTPRKAFDLLREKAEAAGVFVILKGDLGHHTKTLDVSIFRGFCIADKIAPFIVINNRDTVTAWSFTLLHEFVHLILGNSAIISKGLEGKIEVFCNNVASEFLLPKREARTILPGPDMEFELALDRIRDFAEKNKLSRSMVALRAHKEGLISRSMYDRMLDELQDHWLENKPKKTKSSSGGAVYYPLNRRNLGNGLIKLVKRMVDSEALTTTRASMILGVKPQNVRKLVNSTEL